MSRASSTLVTTSAYLPLVLHAAKYQSRSVVGLLVSSSAAAAGTAGASVVVDSVLPLFHTTPLAPSIEIALTQAEAILPASSTIVGVYYAPELYEPRTTSGGGIALPAQAATAIKIVDKIREVGRGQAGTRILLLDAVSLGALGAPNSSSSHSALEIFERSASSSSSWTNTGVARIVASGAQASTSDSETATEFVVAQLRALVKADKQRMLSDFDDHLDDVKADWTNAEFEKNVLPTGAK